MIHRVHLPRTIAAMLIALAVFVAAMATGASRAPVWQVYALRYATVRAFPVHELVAGADTTRTADLAMMFWLLKGPAGRRVLVDCGFHRQKFLDAWKPADYVRPSDVVRRFGIPPESITDIVVSHVHWDHADGADLFPNARIWIQRAEYEHYVGAGGTPLDAQIDTVDAAMLASLDRAGRLKRVEGDAQVIAPGVTAYIGGKHTFESQYVGVNTAKGIVVVASDNVYLYENLEKHVPIAATYDAASNLAAQDRMKRLASSPRLILPGHDPAVFERFKAIGPGVVRIE